MQKPYDVPDLPFKKPKEFETIEMLGPDALNSMRRNEIDELILLAANESARNYKEAGGDNFEDCRNIVTMALETTGNAIGGSFGAMLVAESEIAAEKAARLIFPEQED